MQLGVDSPINAVFLSADEKAETDIKDFSSWLSPWRERVQSDAAAAGIPLLDLTAPLLSSMREGDVPWFWGDTHLNAAGHEVMAGAVASWIAPWLDPAQPGSP